MKLKLSLIGILVNVLFLGGCQQNLSHSNRDSDSKGVMSRNQNVTVVEQTRLNTVDISKVNSFNKLRSSTEGLFRLGKNGRVVNGLYATIDKLGTTTGDDNIIDVDKNVDDVDSVYVDEHRCVRSGVSASQLT